MKSKPITRRTLLKKSALAAIGSSLFFSSPLKAISRIVGEKKSKVVLVRNKLVLKDGVLDGEVLDKMMNMALLELTGKENIKEAWSHILDSNDILGVKTNVWNHLHTPKMLEDNIVAGARSIGIAENDISVNDRSVINDKVFQRATALINIRPMRTHAWSGVGSLIKNYIMFDPKPSAYHPDSCADLATAWNLPNVKGKTRLNILVMLTPLFHGVGPHHFNKQFTWQYNGLLLGYDPVAIDSVGLRIIQAKRTEYFKENTPLNPPAKHIMLADTRHHLGTANPELIDLVKIGSDEGSFV